MAKAYLKLKLDLQLHHEEPVKTALNVEPRKKKRKLCRQPQEVKVEAVCRVLLGEPRERVRKSIGVSEIRPDGTAEATLRDWINDEEIRMEAERKIARENLKMTTKEVMNPLWYPSSPLLWNYWNPMSLAANRYCKPDSGSDGETMSQFCNAAAKLPKVLAAPVCLYPGSPLPTISWWNTMNLMANRCHKSDTSSDSGIDSAPIDLSDASIDAEIPTAKRNEPLRRTSKNKRSTISNGNSRWAAKRKRVQSDSTDDDQPAKRHVIKERASSSKRQNYQQVVDFDSMNCTELLYELVAKGVVSRELFVYFSESLQ